MQEAEQGSSGIGSSVVGGGGGGGGGGDDDETATTPVKAIRNALSTLVIADFFVVCFFLLWFLAGIFASYVLKNDDVQIAFNGLFQPVVQPALGILMIAAIADRVFAPQEVDEGGGVNEKE